MVRKSTVNGAVRPLDIVRTPKGAIAIVTEVGTSKYGNVAIEFLKHQKPTHEHVAWWHEDELTVLDSLPVLLANAVAHNMGDNQGQGEKFFGTKGR